MDTAGRYPAGTTPFKSQADLAELDETLAECETPWPRSANALTPWHWRKISQRTRHAQAQAAHDGMPGSCRQTHWGGQLGVGWPTPTAVDRWCIQSLMESEYGKVIQDVRKEQKAKRGCGKGKGQNWKGKEERFGKPPFHVDERCRGVHCGSQVQTSAAWSRWVHDGWLRHQWLHQCWNEESVWRLAKKIAWPLQEARGRVASPSRPVLLFRPRIALFPRAGLPGFSGKGRFAPSLSSTRTRQNGCQVRVAPFLLRASSFVPFCPGHMPQATCVLFPLQETQQNIEQSKKSWFVKKKWTQQ